MYWAGKWIFLFGNLPSQLLHASYGGLRGLGINTQRRAELLPDVSTISASGVKGFEATSWFGWFAPGGAPTAVIGRLHSEITRIVQSPDMKARLLNDGTDLVSNTPRQFVESMSADIAK